MNLVHGYSLLNMQVRAPCDPLMAGTEEQLRSIRDIQLSMLSSPTIPQEKRLSKQITQCYKITVWCMVIRGKGGPAGTPGISVNIDMSGCEYRGRICLLLH